MEKYLQLLSRNRLFEGISPDKIPTVLKTLNARVRSYEKGGYIGFQGERMEKVGIVLKGKVRLQKENESVFIINDYTAGAMFGEALTFAGNAVLPFNILAAADSEILFADFGSALSGGSLPPALTVNILRLLSERILFFHGKLDIMEKHTIRGRLLSFFEPFYARHGDGWFTVPYNRNALAEYLGVNRSALSRELSQMSRDGLLKYEKNKFKICIPLFKKI